ncbi:glycosyltransferase family 9 protein [Stieleria sp. TO1_6]|uniref:glycosyltransferase family 9 protein n=1 Tax=Stieleria tagensis TaxID=2956795 RepID=UPI00209B3334|nr:glycosyltransferase family 9 protein [Stieleria tagensis]MCO8122071.1 glycosyltransferase family 9 protein [Stieleria tagensis]
MSNGERTRKSDFRKRSQRQTATKPTAPIEVLLETDSPRFLISRMSAIGDTILTLPVACALRDRFPKSHISWIVEEKSAPVVRRHSAVDDLIVLERSWFTSPSRLRNARQQLRDLRCDVSIDCQGMTKSSLACYLSGAQHRIGYAGKNARELSRWFSNIQVKPVFHHLTDRSLELLTPLGIHSPAVRWDLPVSGPAQSWARRYRSTVSAPRVAILNPGATWHSKRWLPERFGATARYLYDRYGYTSIAVWGTSLDRSMAMDIVSSSNGTAILAPETDLQHLAALIGTADLFISNDTGPLHMAVAVGTRTIGLYGATKPGDSGPYGQTAIQMAYESGSSRQRRNASNAAMCAIGVEHVCAAIDQFEQQRQLPVAA